MRTSILLLFLTVFSQVTTAQLLDSLPPLGGDLDSWYDESIDMLESPLMQGIYYIKDDVDIVTKDEHPFYLRGWDLKGTLSYEGTSYQDVGLIYNISEGVLLLNGQEMMKDGLKSLLINQAKVDSFTIHGKKFVNHRFTELEEQGFLRRIVQTKNITCYAKESKEGLLKRLNYEYKDRRVYFIQVNGQTHKYKGLSSIYKIFPAYKAELKKFVRNNIAAAERRSELALRLALLHCDELIR